PKAIAIASTKDFFIVISSSSMRDIYLLQNLLAEARAPQPSKSCLVSSTKWITTFASEIL
ncbi:MAG: hypothetical protein ACI3XH_01610, partial [Phascolarctobacterium sp.]